MSTLSEHCQRARKNGPERLMGAVCVFSGTALACSVSALRRGRDLEMGGCESIRSARINIRRDVLTVRPVEKTELILRLNGEDTKLVIDEVTELPHGSSWSLYCTKAGKGA